MSNHIKYKIVMDVKKREYQKSVLLHTKLYMYIYIDIWGKITLRQQTIIQQVLHHSSIIDTFVYKVGLC